MNVSNGPQGDSIKKEFFRLRTYHGSFLWADPTRGEIVHVAADAEATGLLEVLLFMPSPILDFAILFARSESALIWSFRLLNQLSGPGLSLLDVRRRHLLTAEPLGPGGSGATVRSRNLAMGWENFTPCLPSVETLNWTPPNSINELLSQAAVLNGSLWSYQSALELARSENPLIVSFARGVVADLEPLVFDQVAAAISRSPREFSSFLDLSEANDVWRTDAFLEYQSWSKGSRQPIRIGHIGVELDVLDQDNPPDSRLMGKRLLHAARRQTPSTRTICIVSALRNEGPYILEWIAYHKAIGVDHFFLYSNSNDDGSDELLRELANAGEVTWIQNEIGSSCRPQLKAYNHALSLLPDTLDYRWTLMIDLDEFLVINAAFDGLKNYLRNQSLRRCDVVAFNWLFFGSSGHARWSPTPVTEKFTQSLGVNKHIKTAFRTNMFTNAGAHNPTHVNMNDVEFRDEAGETYTHEPGVVAFAAAPKAIHAWVNHYFYRSAEEFLWKNSRNRGDQTLEGDKVNWSMLSDSWIEGFLGQFKQSNQIVDNRINWYDTSAKLQLKRLIANIHVREAALSVNAAADERLKRLRDEFLSHARDQGTSLQREFATLLES